MIPSGRSIATLVRQACRLEVLADKPGNVSPSHSFDNATVDDFLKSADAIAPILQTAADRPLGTVIREAVAATSQVVGHNTNLGIILLLAPLCAVRNWENAAGELTALLAKTTITDAIDLYEAIRIASPGGLGSSAKQDVSQAPTSTLLECMRLAAERDSIAAEYSTGFEFVFRKGLPLLCQTSHWQQHDDKRLGWLAVQILATQSDTLIVRKCGPDVANEVQRMAEATVSDGWPFCGSDKSYSRLHAFLVADGHRRNPGTTADLIAAILFCGLRSGFIDCDDSETNFIFTSLKS